MKRLKNKRLFLLVITMMIFCNQLAAQEWQWSVVVDSVISDENKDHPVAFLWIPPDCKQVRGVVVTQHNMIEEGILENAGFRASLAAIGFAEIWISPGINITFDFNHGAGNQFNYMMKLLANQSGYKELEFAPVVPMGHSAFASYPWNFAAWNPGRTLAAISVHGDAPLTNLTGSGKPNPDWGDKNIDGVPCLFVMGEFEWWEKRIEPAFDYISRHPASTISLFADAGHGHFDYSDELIQYLSMFIRKAAENRLPKSISREKAAVLKPINPQQGWLMDRWHKDSLPLAKPASFKAYTGDRKQASWCFDEDMVNATEKYYATARGKQNQHIGFSQNGKIVKPAGGHAQFDIPFIPLQDGISFNLKAFFSDTSKIVALEAHAKTDLIISRICGPVKKINDTTFQLSFYRMGFNSPKRSNDVWLLASNKGDEIYKSAVQQLDMRFPLVNKEGRQQKITFKKITDQRQGIKYLKMKASTDAAMQVYYYIKEGPAEIDGNTIKFTEIPPRSKFPIKVTVVAWQYGRATEPPIQSAEPVFQSFYIFK
ncbi:MAG: hypothetical protein ABIU77_28595 [Ferruginibacter sp.]